MLSVIPRADSDYRSQKEVLEAWNANRDFTVSDFFSRWDGKAVNKSDHEGNGGGPVKVRYGNLRKVMIIK